MHLLESLAAERRGIRPVQGDAGPPSPSADHLWHSLWECVSQENDALLRSAGFCHALIECAQAQRDEWIVDDRIHGQFDELRARLARVSTPSERPVR